MNQSARIILIFLISLSFCTTATAFSKKPVSLLLQAKGHVEYSKDGEKWKQVRRNKFLFKGYLVRTDSDGSCKLLNLRNNTITELRNDTLVKVYTDMAETLRGKVSNVSMTENVVNELGRKYASVQRYAVVQRAVIVRHKKIQLNPAEDITLSEDYPDMVWENTGSEYSYQLIVGEKIFDVPGSDKDVIRYTLTHMHPGVFPYRIRVLHKKEIIYDSELTNHLQWLSDSERKALRKQEREIRRMDPDNGFLIGNLLDEKGLKIAAMDCYQKFLSENPDANEIRPFLLKIYHELNLEKRKQVEIIRYNSSNE